MVSVILQDPVVHKYGHHNLQTLSVWQQTPALVESTRRKYWIIYLHGGAWRDARISNVSFLPTIKSLCSKHADATPHIAAFASIDYRLSPHPDLPQDKERTAPNSLRNARHPDHLNDVNAGITFLQEKYGFKDDYVLVGHSCGATLAFQTTRNFDISNGQTNDLVEAQAQRGGPAAIIGIAGIYDLRLMRDNHAHPVYQSYISGAFGEDETVWDAVSPARFVQFAKGWADGETKPKVVVLAHSRDDELVEEAQIESMARKLRQEDTSGPLVVVLNGEKALRGTHDELWEEGREIANCIDLALKELLK